MAAELASTQDDPLSVLVVGAGQRGCAYAAAIHSETLRSRCRVTAVAEIDSKKRRHFVTLYSLKPENVFADWREVVNLASTGRELCIDGVILCTLDWQHAEPAMAFSRLGYHVMLEKPLSTTWKSTMGIIDTFREAGRLFAVGHVLRYSPFYILLKRLLSEKRVAGQILHVQHTERVGWWHFAHSYVRGNWRNDGANEGDEESGQGQPSFLAKCCHDTDLLFWLLDDRPPTEIQDRVDTVDLEPSETIYCNKSLEGVGIDLQPNSGRQPETCGMPTSVFSVAGRPLFRHHNRPPNSGTHCVDCPIEPSCLYSAKRIYLTHSLKNPTRGSEWPTSVLVPDIEDYPESKQEEAVLSALAPDSGNHYGRCVWDVPDNNVYENQTATFSFEGGVIATLDMVATAGPASKRLIAIYGTLGEVHADDAKRRYQPRSGGAGGTLDAHGGGDFGLAKAFVDAMWQVEREGQNVQEAQSRTLGIDCRELEMAYRAVWVAEKSKKTGLLVPWNSEI